MNANPLILCPESKSGSRRVITGGIAFIMQDAQSEIIKEKQSIKCGRELTHYGKFMLCETRPCDK